MEMCYDGALVMPSNYAVMSEDEMTYVEGGKVYTASQCRNFVCALGFCSGSALMAVAFGAAIAKKVLNIAGRLGGPVAWIIKTAGALLLTALGKIAYGIGYSAVSGKKLVINASPAPWDAFVSVGWKK